MPQTISLVGPASMEKAVLFYGRPTVAPRPRRTQNVQNTLRCSPLPCVLAGPIVRRTEGNRVWIWIAAAVPVHIEGWVAPAGEVGTMPGLSPLGHGQGSSFALGHHLHIALVEIGTFTPPGKPLCRSYPSGVILGYNLALTVKPEATGWEFHGEVAFHPEDVALSPFTVPTFIVPDLQRAHAHFLHASCRKLHGNGDDAAQFALNALRAAANDPRSRPTTLLLTGDQIYADDVDQRLIPQIAHLGCRLLGRDEQIPGTTQPVRQLAAGSRGPIVRRGGFTADADVSGNHLLGFGDFAATYLFAWSDEITRRFGVNLGQKTKEMQILLANTSTYMICDDHEITDDWNLTYEMYQRTKSDPATRRVIANGLAAFWAFQAIGNDPEHAFPGASAVREYLSSTRSNGDNFDEAMWSARNFGFVAAMNPPVIVLDTRTQRLLPQRPTPGQFQTLPGLLDHQAQAWFLSKVRALEAPLDVPVVIVAPCPFIGYTEIEELQRVSGCVDRVLCHLDPAADPEAWAFHRRVYFQVLDGLIETGRRRFVFLSGDVHYGFTVAARYTRRHGGHNGVIDIVQLTSTALKNAMSWPQGFSSHLARISIDRDTHVRIGWDQQQDYPPYMVMPGERLAPSRPWDIELRWRFCQPSNSDETIIKKNNVGLVEMEWSDAHPWISQSLETGQSHTTLVHFDQLSLFLGT